MESFLFRHKEEKYKMTPKYPYFSPPLYFTRLFHRVKGAGQNSRKKFLNFFKFCAKYRIFQENQPILSKKSQTDHKNFMKLPHLEIFLFPPQTFGI